MADPINTVYSNVEDWSAGLGITTDNSRTVLMSEDIIQKFSVPDAELSILDLSKSGKPLLSFVPFGLFIMGANSLIDIILKQEQFFFWTKRVCRPRQNGLS